MARKSEGTPRKSASSRKSTAKQSNPATPAPVTPIREGNFSTTENGASQLDPRIELDIRIEGEIRLRAYELYLERGGLHGFDQEDWRQAEEEILAKYHREKSA